MKKLEELEQRLDVIEGMLNIVIEELRLLRRSKGSRTYGAGEGERLLRYIREKLFMDVEEVYSRSHLRRLVERGMAILLRDDAANREFLTTRESIRRLYEKLPLSISSIDSLNEREYQLLLILNRLGYVILKDNEYVPTELIRELL